MPAVESPEHHQLLGLLVKPHGRTGPDGRRNRRLLFGPCSSVKCPSVVEVGRAETAKQHDFLADRVIDHSVARPCGWRCGWGKLFPIRRRWIGRVGKNRERCRKHERSSECEQNSGDMASSKHWVLN